MPLASPTKIKPPYKGENGKFFTRQLFLEQWYLLEIAVRTIEPLFSFHGTPGYIPFRSTFVELRDPTGYRWAMKYLSSWEHFEVLKASKWFTVDFEAAVDEIKSVLKAEAIEKIVTIASGDTPQALLASKYLASGEWEKPSSTRGRPSKAEMKGELKRAVQTWTMEEEDAQRMGLVINGRA